MRNLKATHASAFTFVGIAVHAVGISVHDAGIDSSAPRIRSVHVRRNDRSRSPGIPTNKTSPHGDYQTINGVAPNTLPREWHDLVHDHPDDKQAFNRRQLEVVVILELVTAIKAGEIFVSGSLSFDRFWDRLPSDAAVPVAIAAYAAARGWGDGADGLVRSVKKALDQKANFLDAAVGTDDRGYLRPPRANMT